MDFETNVRSKKNPLIIGIIDDDQLFHLIIKNNLSRLNFDKKVLFFSDGKEAIAYLTEHRNNSKSLPDMLFLDIKMPVMDGFQFMDVFIALKAQLKKIAKIHMVTASLNRHDIKRAREIQEISEYVLKPVKLNDLKSLFIHNAESTNHI